jgi:hypothetical protein
MPSYTRGRARDVLTYVAVNTKLFYGFKTKDLSAIAGVSAGDLTSQLGHVSPAAVAAGGLLCLGANAPKPPRVTKKIANAVASAQGSVSTFCAYNRLAQATAGGWVLSKQGREVGLRTDGRSITALVEIAPNGVLYAFSMNRADFDAFGQELGLQSAASMTTTAEIDRIVFASSMPKPGRATKAVANGTVSTFYDPAKKADLQQPTSGWRVSTAARLLTAAAAPPA